MRKPIPTSVHGVLDYMTAGLLFALPRVMGWSPCATRVLDTAAIGAVGYSLLTRYELGAVKVLPMQAHLTLDALSGSALLGAAALMEDEEPEVRGTIAALGVFEIGAALMSQTTPRSTTGGSAMSTAGAAHHTAAPMFEGRTSEPSMPTAGRIEGDASGETNVARTATM